VVRALSFHQKTESKELIRLICFANTAFNGGSKEFLSNDPDLTITGDDFLFASVIVIEGNWTLYDAVGFGGNAVTISRTSGPESDGVYRDYADWSGAAAFHVKSIQRS
jgi:hypothetical protein